MHHNFIKEDKTPVLQITAHTYMDEYIYIYICIFSVKGKYFLNTSTSLFNKVQF